MSGQSDERMQRMQRNARHAAGVLRQLGNASRFLLLGEIARGEATVAQLERSVGIGQPALSQHLAELRRSGLVKTRRESRSIHYSIADDRAQTLVEALGRIFDGGAGPVAALRPQAPARTVRCGDTTRFGKIMALPLP
jgi:DNA-binding transcriptional ArsR family regulator